MTFLLWLSVIFVHVLPCINFHTSDSQCPEPVLLAERKFYSDPEARFVSNRYMNRIQHGGYVMNKCSFLARQQLLELSHQCDGLCKNHMEGVPHRMKRSVPARECPEDRMIECPDNRRYRTINGSCNNLNNPRWGMSDRIENRFIPAKYDNGIYTPRVQNSKKNGSLPSARKVSNMLHAASNDVLLDDKFSLMIMQWGQFLAHDIVLTPIQSRADGSEFECCHHDTDEESCFPIRYLEERDPRLKCISLSRSVGQYDCNKIWQHINTQSSYIDGSVIYGANQNDSDRLRLKERGLMMEIDGKLPRDVNDALCRLNATVNTDEIYCGISGDSRVNEQPALAAIHTLFLREHNRLAQAFQDLNPEWNDTIVFEEARRVVAAEIQVITYKEFLPSVLSPKIMSKYNLHTCPEYRRINSMSLDPYDDCHDNYMYDIDEDATITNVFAAAILRFGHSLVNRLLGKTDKNNEATGFEQPLDNFFFDPGPYHEGGREGLEEILRFFAKTKSARSDHIFENTIRNELFRDSKNETMDLVSLNIQRGRDHGLPGYNDFRQFCGFPTANNFSVVKGGLVNHTEEMARRLGSVYQHPDDIDVFVGAVTEIRDENSLLGPLQQCLMARMFKKLKFGDYYYFETPKMDIRFTPAQLASIQKSSLASVFCANTETTQIQPHMFQVPTMDGTNDLVKCDVDIHEIDLNLWDT